MRGRCGALIAAAALAAVASPAAAAAPGPRAAVLFLPGPVLSQPGLSLGLTSPTLGGYRRPQVSIDISQGARISTRAYTRPLPPLRLQAAGHGPEATVLGWDRLVRRARDAPGDVVPGLLASTIERAGGSVAYAGVSGAEDTESFAAADRGGRIGRASIGPAAGFGARAVALWRSSSLLVARLPAGSRAVADFLRARRPQDLVVVVQAPPVKPLTLLYTGAVGPGISGGGTIRSATTRRDGYIAAPDISATVLDTLGLKVPKKMQGERIESRSGHGAAYVRDLKARLDAILPHRDRAVEIIGICWVVVALLLWLARRRDGLRAAARVFFLAAIWTPALALLTAAIEPSANAEALVLALGGLGLGSLTDRLLPWPAAPLLPAAVTFGAHTIDLALGSRLIGLSIAGPNPKGGSRFFGVGNELEIVLALTVLLGTGAALTRLPERAAPRVFALSALVSAVIIGAGRLGADVGAVITLGAGGAAAVVISLPRGPTPRAIALAIVVPVLGVAALALLDFAIGGGAHLTHTLSSSSGPGDLGKVALRRWRLSTSGLTHGSMPFVIGVCLVLLVLGVVKRRELLQPLSDERYRPFRAAVVGSFFAVVIGALANDSGPMIVMIGTVSLILTLGYVMCGTPSHTRPKPRLPSPGCA